MYIVGYTNKLGLVAEKYFEFLYNALEQIEILMINCKESREEGTLKITLKFVPKGSISKQIKFNEWQKL